MKRLSMLLLPLTLATASVAHAGVIVTITPQGTPTDSFGDVAPGFIAYKVTLSTDDGNLLAGFDFGGNTLLNGTKSTNGLFGPFLQDNDVAQGRSGFTETATPIETGSNSPSSAYSVDTHFMINPNVVLMETAPTEDNNGINPTGSPADILSSGGADWGTGSYLEGIFAFSPAANRVASVDLAYLVLPVGATATYSADVNEATSAGTVISAQHISGTIGSAAVPEPASLGVLAVGGIAFLKRRKA